MNKYPFENDLCPYCGRGPVRIGLTARQTQLVEYLESHRDYQGVMPSYQEMTDAMGLKSKSGIHRMILSLEERGIIRRIPHRARAIEIIA